MRNHAIARKLLPLTTSVFAFAIAGAGFAAAPGSATLAYQQRVNGIATQIIVKALVPHFALLRGGTVKLTYRVGVRGNVQGVKLIGAHPNRVITDSCISAIKAATFPPIPQSVVKEQGHNWVDVDTEIGIDR
jgi:hypothetical protein